MKQSAKIAISNKIKKYGLWTSLTRGLVRLLDKLVHHRFNLTYEITRKVRGSAIKSVNGFKMWLDLKNDLGIAKDLFIYGKREHLSTDLVLSSNIIRPGDTTLDIGANIGYYALIESKLVGPAGLVYAIEPVKRNFDNLNRNIQLNNITNIKTYNLAISDSDGMSEINVGTRGNWSSLVYDANKNFTHSQPIKTNSVDTFLKDKQSPSFVRMDVEGYEYQILKGMTQTLSKPISLLIEIHPTILSPKQIKEIIDILKKNDFSNVTAIFDPPLRTLTPRGKPKLMSRFILKHLQPESDKNPTTPININLDELEHLLLTKNRHIHTLLQKN